MKDFAAIDFETANGKRTSVCSVGVVVVRGGEVTDSFYSLIRPRPNFYSRFTTAIHGLTYDDTAEAPDFETVWKQIAPRIEGLPLVAHNSPFDEGCLRAVFELYGMPYPGYRFRPVSLCLLQNGLENHRRAEPTILYRWLSHLL